MPDVTPKCSEILNIAFQVTPDFLRKLAGLGTLLTAPWDASGMKLAVGQPGGASRASGARDD